MFFATFILCFLKNSVAFCLSFLDQNPQSSITLQFALAISNKREIGLDLEAIREPKHGLISYACSEEEQKYVRDGRTFFEIWTAKESLVKASGRGIDRAAKSIPALPLSGLKQYLDEDYYSVSISFGNYVFSVTLKGKEGFSIINLLNENLEYNLKK